MASTRRCGRASPRGVKSASPPCTRRAKRSRSKTGSHWPSLALWFAGWRKTFNLTTKARRHEENRRRARNAPNKPANAESTYAHVSAERAIASVVAMAQTLPHCPFCSSSCLRAFVVNMSLFRRKRRAVKLGDRGDQRRDQMLGTAEAEIHRMRQSLQRRCRHRTCHTELHGHLVVVTHVLQCIGEPELHPGEIAFDRLARQHLENARVCCAGRNQLEVLLRIHAELRARRQRFRDQRHLSDRRAIVDQLDLVTRAGVADVENVLAECVEHRLDLLERGRV